MTPSRWRQIDSLYRASKERPASERPSYLDQACAGDRELRSAVEALLDEDHSQSTEASTTVMAPVISRQIGSYVIETQIGEGGMGVVYKAFDAKLNRAVAVKVLSDELADAAACRRFQREAQTASSLNHPHIVTVYDTGEFEGRQYLVTEYIDGGTLRSWSRAQPRTWREIVELLTGVADGLAAAHEAKILHRDLKPANILVMTSGYAKLADFGLAKLVADSPDAASEAKTLSEQRTRTGMVLGTIAYMSPEQALGKPLDARSDIFSFGVVLYELLAGARPFDGRSELETLQKVIHAPQPALPEEIPAPLRALVDRALQKDPAERYQSMRELVADLRSITRGGDSGVVSAQALAPPVTAPRFRRPALVYSAAVALLLAIAAGAWYFRASRGPVTNPSEYVQLTDFSDYATAPAISRDGTMLAFFRGGSYFLGTGRIYVKQLSSGESKQLTDDPHRKYNPVFTPDGSRVAYTVFNPPPLTPGDTSSPRSFETWTVPVLGGAPSRLMPNAAGLSWLAGNRILFSAVMPGTVVHMGVVTSEESRADERAIYFPSHERGMAHYSYASPDQRSLLLVEMDRRQAWQRCRLVPMDGSSAGTLVGPQGGCTAAGWNPDGKWMYLNVEIDDRSHLWRQRYPNGVPEQITFGPTEEEGLAVAPDGKSLIASIGVLQKSIWITDASGDHRLPLEGSASTPLFPADGRGLYYLVKKGAPADSVELWMRDLASGKSDLILAGQKIADYDISPDQKQAVFTVRNGAAYSIFIAPVDRSAAPRLIAKDADSPNFAGPTEIVFRQLGENASHLARVHADGTGMERLLEMPIESKMGGSPDGEWAIAGGFSDPSRAAGTYAVSLKDRSQRYLCAGPCVIRWSPDGKFLFVTVNFSPADAKNSLTATGRTFVFPEPHGMDSIAIPVRGISPDDQEIPGARVIPKGDLSPGPGGKTWAYTVAEFEGNLFRIPLH